MDSLPLEIIYKIMEKLPIESVKNFSKCMNTIIPKKGETFWKNAYNHSQLSYKLDFDKFLPYWLYEKYEKNNNGACDDVWYLLLRNMRMHNYSGEITKWRVNHFSNINLRKGLAWQDFCKMDGPFKHIFIDLPSHVQKKTLQKTVTCYVYLFETMRSVMNKLRNNYPEHFDEIGTADNHGEKIYTFYSDTQVYYDLDILTVYEFGRTANRSMTVGWYYNRY